MVDIRSTGSESRPTGRLVTGLIVIADRCTGGSPNAGGGVACTDRLPRRRCAVGRARQTGHCQRGGHIRAMVRQAQGAWAQYGHPGAGLAGERHIRDRLAEAMSAHTFCVGLIGAALRLGVDRPYRCPGGVGAGAPGYLELTGRTPCMGLDEVSAFSPQQEIAVMRHETMSYRLFIN